MRRPYRPGNGIKRHSARLRRKLHFGPDVEKRKVARYQMVRDARRLVQHVNLPAEHVLCLFKRVVRRLGGPGLDLVEARGEVCGGRGGLRADACGG